MSALLGAGLIAWLYRHQERWDTVKDHLHQHRYAEWISAGTLSAGIGNQYVPVQLLEDLVDIGIDMSKRVIYDRDQDVYAVIDRQMVYYCEGSMWTEQSGESTNNDEFQYG